jgi:DNA-binding transcriptional LysR family regulator
LDRIESLRIFTRVVECASFTGAADSLQIPRSTVSTAILVLEMRVGARLLHRTTRRVAPTHDGSVFYERCLRLLADYEETETLFRHSAARPSGKLKIDVPGRIGRLVIAPALPDFFDRYPEIEIEMGVSDRLSISCRRASTACCASASYKVPRSSPASSAIWCCSTAPVPPIWTGTAFRPRSAISTGISR